MWAPHSGVQHADDAGQYVRVLSSLGQVLGGESFPHVSRNAPCQSWLLLMVGSSWTSAFVTLVTAAPYERRDTALERFLSDRHTSQLLVRPFNAFPPPTPQSSSAFQTWTAAIHITPNSRTKSDIEQLKEDTLWLSRDAKIDEISALRIAIIEWQSRPGLQLQGELDDEAPWNNSARGTSSLFHPISSIISADAEPRARLRRRYRLAKLYLSERRHFLKIVEILVRTALSDSFSAGTKGKGKGKAMTTWVDAVGKTILNARRSGDQSISGTESFLIESIERMQSHTDALITGAGMLSDQEEGAEQIEMEWERCILLEMIHLGQLIFNLIDATTGVLPSSVVLVWFRFAARHRFFDGSELAAQVRVPAMPNVIH